MFIHNKNIYLDIYMYFFLSNLICIDTIFYFDIKKSQKVKIYIYLPKEIIDNIYKNIHCKLKNYIG